MNIIYKSYLYDALKGVIFGLVITWIGESIIYNNPYLREHVWDHPKLIFQHHWHHSLIGLCFIGLCLIAWIIPKKFIKNKFLISIQANSLFYFGLGLGIIIIHTLSDGRFIFIE